MTDTAIRVENPSKLYHIGKAQKRHDTLRDAIVGAFNVSASEHSNDDTIWALKEVSFERLSRACRGIKRGEVVGTLAPHCVWCSAGVIGRNGAGKSTLASSLDCAQDAQHMAQNPLPHYRADQRACDHQRARGFAV